MTRRVCTRHSLRHCEEPLRRPRPPKLVERRRKRSSLPVLPLDCFAALAMTGRVSSQTPRPSLRGALATTASAEARRAKAEAIQSACVAPGLLRCARNDVDRYALFRYGVRCG